MNHLGYLLVCPFAYLLGGGTKFLINSARARRLAFDQIGLGRLPSTHTAIVSGPAWLILLREGYDTPAFAVALGVVMIVAIDAMDLRRKLQQVNGILRAEFPASDAAQRLRDRVAHTLIEIAAGLVAGGVAALLAARLG